jgi:hypothetical protein
MKNLSFKMLASLLVFMLIMVSCVKPDYTKLPTDVKKIADLKLNNWFANGKVMAANSVDFNNGTNLDFYKWSEQMFLWITSPEDNTIVLETPEFYTVSPPYSSSGSKKRDLIPHNPSKTLSASVNIIKLDTEEGQAGSDDVLMSRDGSILYYITFVNDVYAKFLDGSKKGKLNDSISFPTTQRELDNIIAFAKSIGETVRSPETLTMELKTSWVDLATIPLDIQKEYITVRANVPTYDRSSDKKWTPTGKSQIKTLALLGMHVVGSVKGHPEMIWATFEHRHNSPNLTYDYVDENGKTKTVGADTGNHWLLNSNTSDDRAYYNVSRMSLDHKGLITANQSQSSVIGSSNTKRINAFGVAYDNKAKPNNENKSTAESNSQIIAVNNTVRDQLIAGDVRKNYIFIGATWTQNGATPTGKSYSVKKKQTSPGVAVGTSQLANSTMETYFQYGAGKFNSNDASCFSCHSGSLAPNAAFDLSHIYSQLLEGEILSLHTPN